MTTQRPITILVLLTLIGLTCSSTVSKLAVEVDDHPLARPSVSRRQLRTSVSVNSTDLSLPRSRKKGRVAAGAIAERYLKLAHGVEIVAFVSSVGKIHMPTAENEEEDVDSEEYLRFLKQITREKVDQNTIRCPHEEIAKQMEEVGGSNPVVRFPLA
jgi:chorismate synthase